MKLVFEKLDPQTVDIKIDDAGQILDFDYVIMLKGLLQSGRLEESELKGEFSDVEICSIGSMIKHLNRCVASKEDQVDLDDNLEPGVK